MYLYLYIFSVPKYFSTYIQIFFLTFYLFLEKTFVSSARTVPARAEGSRHSLSLFLVMCYRKRIGFSSRGKSVYNRNETSALFKVSTFPVITIQMERIVFSKLTLFPNCAGMPLCIYMYMFMCILFLPNKRRTCAIKRGESRTLKMGLIYAPIIWVCICIYERRN